MIRPPFKIAIIGAGFSGTLLAVHLMRQQRRQVHALLIDRSGRFGPGLAYSTRNQHHLLNVRAANMSAFPDDPDHFWRWLQAHGLTGDAGSAQAAFATRSSYGEYIGEIFRAAGASPAAGSQLQPLAGEIAAAQPDNAGWLLHTADGRGIAADSLVLCLGNPPPAWPAPFAERAPEQTLIDNPWNLDAIAALPKDARVLILGTGLTMIDVAIELIDNGHAGPIIAISRRGLLPQTHAPAAPYPPFVGAEHSVPKRAAQLLRLIRRQVRAAAARNVDWRGVLDSMRPFLPAIWRGLPDAEKRRFMRHGQAWWDVHRHRMAPQVAGRIAQAIREGRLTTHGGRIRRLDRVDGAWTAGLDPRKPDGPRRLVFDAAINCSGPDLDFRRRADGLIGDLLARGIARADPLGMGLEVTEQRRIVAADGRAWPNFHAIGPLTKGAFWETTAVPELRGQAADLAARLVPE